MIGTWSQYDLQGIIILSRSSHIIMFDLSAQRRALICSYKSICLSIQGSASTILYEQSFPIDVAATDCQGYSVLMSQSGCRVESTTATHCCQAPHVIIWKD